MTYELAPYQMSLFNDGLLRKTDKSQLYKIFKKEDIDLNNNECVFIIDGGWLLNRLQWKKGDSFHEIFNSYVTYLQRNFKSDIAAIFGGYSNSSNNIKVVERLRRSITNMPPDIHFDQHMSVTVSRESFISNKNNKTVLSTC